MKKKYTATSKDKKDWIDFTKQIDNISAKEADYLQESIEIIRAISAEGDRKEASNRRLFLKSENETFSRVVRELQDHCDVMMMLGGNKRNRNEDRTSRISDNSKNIQLNPAQD